MMTPLGFYVVALLFCHTPDTEYKYKQWFAKKSSAEMLVKIFNDGVWFENDKGQKCLFHDAKLVEEK